MIEAWNAMILEFLSTPSARRATEASIRADAEDIFLSTPSARRATTPDVWTGRQLNISIHALREEGDSKLADKIGIIIS